MCVSCWHDYGKPVIKNENVLKARNLINYIYGYHGAGSNYHVVIDDWNLENEMVEECLKTVREGSHHQLTKHQQEQEVAFGELFKMMTIEERASAIALAHGYFGEGKPV